MTTCEVFLSIDAGGTFFKYSCFDEGGNILLSTRQTPVDSQGSKDEIISVYADIYTFVSKYYNIRAIGIATPGPFDYIECKSFMKHKFSSLYGLDLKREICSSIHADPPIYFMSDTAAFLLGACKTNESCIGVTIGTGIGMAIMDKGKILTNAFGAPREVIYNKPVDNGKTVEDYVSGRGICAMYGAEKSSLTAKDISILALSGDVKAQNCFKKLGLVLGKALNEYVTKYNVTKIILGGQVSKSAILFSNELRSCLTKNVQISAFSASDSISLYGIFRNFHNM